jgi:hypothetical protein
MGSAGSNTDLKTQALGTYVDVIDEESTVEWRSDALKVDSEVRSGWTFVFQPNYPEVDIVGLMANGASGFKVVGVHAGTMLQTDSRYIETYDWIVPNVTCTPTTMHCPLPSTWAHVDYTTPSLYPEPAEGSCLQVKTGSSDFEGCSNMNGLEARWYNDQSTAGVDTAAGANSAGQNLEENGQTVSDDTGGRDHNNWAGNCGDAASYFWFEKIACGSTRTFWTDRSLIVDFVQLTPTPEHINEILGIYYTTKAPLGADIDTPGITFINADYHIPPVLPPKVNCTCHAGMDAYASLLSVVSETPTPGAPITLDPEVLNTGTSKLVATLRMYQDPTYSIPASSADNMPIVISRFYLEVSTKFTRNRITIEKCNSAHTEAKLNASDALYPRKLYCDNSTFDTRTEPVPAGVTHMDRISMKKFKFQSTTDVFMQCKIRACAQQPCGTCSRRNLRNLQSVDLSPSEGEMFAPPIGVRVSHRDQNALVFSDPVGAAPSAPVSPSVQPMSSVQGKTSKAIEVSSELTLTSVTPQWAIQNRAALTQTLRSTLNLFASEELVITSISAARRGRSLQQGGVKIDFTVGVSDSSRATASQAQLNQLSSGSPSVVQQFSTNLDAELANRGQAPIALPATAMSFRPAYVQTKVQSTSGAWVLPQANQPIYPTNNQPIYTTNNQPQGAPKSTDSESNSSVLLVLGAGTFACLLLILVIQNGRRNAGGNTSFDTAGPAANTMRGGDASNVIIDPKDVYSSKVQALEN